MPHERRRHLIDPLRGLAKASPLVGLLGHRQSGKTTLLEGVSREYVTLDDLDTLDHSIADPKGFIGGLRADHTAIDECQLNEMLFPVLKDRVRTHKRPGQFLLSGSVRFTSKKIIRESLPGRIMNVELLPMTLSELSNRALPDFGPRLVDLHWNAALPAAIQEKTHVSRKKSLQTYLERGGLPGLCFLKQKPLRERASSELINIILNRDLRQIHETTLPLNTLRAFLAALARREGQPLNHSELQRETGISPRTQKQLLFVFESIFLIRFLDLEGSRADVILYLEDQLESRVVTENRLDAETQWTGLVYRNFREQFFYSAGSTARFFQFRTRSGAVVPFAVRQGERCLGVIPVSGRPTRAQRAAGRSFLQNYSQSKALFVSDENVRDIVDERTAIVGATALLF